MVFDSACQRYSPEVLKIFKKKSQSVPSTGRRDLAYFAAGHFWGPELVYQRVPGVVRTRVGYTRGCISDPSYEDVAGGTSGHCFCVEVTYDTSVITYGELCTVFWDLVNPVYHNKVGFDQGWQVRCGIHYTSEEQKEEAMAQFNEVQKRYKNPIGPEVRELDRFYEADEYYQRHLQKTGQSAEKGCTDYIRLNGESKEEAHHMKSGEKYMKQNLNKRKPTKSKVVKAPRPVAKWVMSLEPSTRTTRNKKL